MTNFIASNCWLDLFKKREALNYKVFFFLSFFLSYFLSFFFFLSIFLSSDLSFFLSSILFFSSSVSLFCRGHATYKSPCWSVGPSVDPSVTLLFFAFLGSLRVEKFVFEHAPAQFITAPAQIITAPAQTITAPAQIITAPAQPPATGAVVYTALFSFFSVSSFFLF